jgi:hypothetical protein
MSNAGKRMLNWKRDFPALRVALGLLGRDGYTSLLVARYLLSHECTLRAREFCSNVLGRELSDVAVGSRLKQVKELAWIKEHNGAAYRAGERLYASLVPVLKKNGFTPFGALGQ